MPTSAAGRNEVARKSIFHAQEDVVVHGISARKELFVEKYSKDFSREYYLKPGQPIQIREDMEIGGFDSPFDPNEGVEATKTIVAGQWRKDAK